MTFPNSSNSSISGLFLTIYFIQKNNKIESDAIDCKKINKKNLYFYSNLIIL